MEISEFLSDKKTTNPPHYKILQKLRKLVKTQFPKVEERIIYGGIMFSLEGVDFGGIFSSKKHVSFEFSHGNQLKDPKKLLEGAGKYRRHLKIVVFDDIEDKEVEFFIQQCAGV